MQPPISLLKNANGQVLLGPGGAGGGTGITLPQMQALLQPLTSQVQGLSTQVQGLSTQVQGICTQVQGLNAEIAHMSTNL